MMRKVIRKLIKKTVRFLLKVDIHLLLKGENGRVALNYVEHVRQVTGAKYKGETPYFTDFLYPKEKSNMGYENGNVYYRSEDIAK